MARVMPLITNASRPVIVDATSSSASVNPAGGDRRRMHRDGGPAAARFTRTPGTRRPDGLAAVRRVWRAYVSGICGVIGFTEEFVQRLR